MNVPIALSSRRLSEEHTASQVATTDDGRCRVPHTELGLSGGQACRGGAGSEVEGPSLGGG